MNYPRKDEKVLAFIKEFRERVGEEPFYSGYCWHFAHMLKATFKRGEVCWNTYSHFVWLDTDSQIAYDIGGIYEGDAPYYVPENQLGKAIEDFLHIPGVGFNATAEHIHTIKRRYIESVRCRCIYSLVSSCKDIYRIENKYDCTVICYCDHPTGNTHYIIMGKKNLATPTNLPYNEWGLDGNDYIYGGLKDDDAYSG